MEMPVLVCWLAVAIGLLYFMTLCQGLPEAPEVEECRDHPRLGSACKNVQNLKEWCERSRFQDPTNKHGFARVCQATCGYCKRSSGKARVFIDDGSSESAETKERKPVLKATVVQVQSQPPREDLFAVTTPKPTPTPAQTCGQPPLYTPCLPLGFSNQFFQQCCQDYGIGPACLHLCRYDVKVEEVQLAHAKQECPFSILPAYFTCASRTKNNLDCCRDTRILTEAGPQCAPFCDPVGTPFGGIGLRHLRCAMYLEEIMHCHWAGLR